MVGPFIKEDKNRGRTVLYQCGYGGSEGIENHEFCFGRVNLKLINRHERRHRVSLKHRIRSRLKI